MKILNSKGEPIVLGEREMKVCAYNQQICNALGIQVDITTLTQIVAKVTEQKFYRIKPSDYVPVRVGQGTWNTQLTTYRSFALGDDFEKGIIDTGANGARLASADAGVDAVNVPIYAWAKEVQWNLFQLEQAMKSGNWDLVTAKEISRKTNWDLGIQSVAFLGSIGPSGVKGLLNLADVSAANTTLITAKLSAMTTDQLKTFTAGAYEAYRANCNRTASPTAFVIPESDFNGLASTVSPDFPIKTVLELLQDSFRLITQNPGFMIRPLAYADAAYNTAAGINKTRYTLLNQDDASIRMDIPMDYNSTMASTINGFSYQNVGMGQFTGVVAYRPLEVLYFDLTPG